MFNHWKSILRIGFPSMGSFASVMLIGTVNLIMVGHLGPLAIAIVGVSSIVMYNATSIFSGIGHTTSYLVAQCYGANDIKKGIERTYIALYLTIIVSLFILITGFFASTPILRLIAGEDQLAIIGSHYLQFRFYALAFGLFSLTFHGFLRGIGDAKTPMYLSIVSNVAMLFLTFVLVFGEWGFPKLGLQGAGIAVLIGEILGFSGCLYIFFIKLNSRFQTRSKAKFNSSETKLILQESGKLGIQEFSLSVTMFIFTIFVSRLGTNALAANEISLNVMSIGFIPAFAFGATATVLIGHHIGKGDQGEARRVGTETAIIGAVIMLFLGVLEFVFVDHIARIYTDNIDVVKLVILLIKISALLQVFEGVLSIYAGGLRGIGDTSFLLWTSICTGCGLFVPSAFVFTFVFHWGSIGAWISLYLFVLVLSVILMIRYYRTDWAIIQTKEAEDLRVNPSEVKTTSV